MEKAEVFVLDANVLMDASRRYYAFDLAKPFWDSLIEYARAGRICSIDRIKGEIDKGKDRLTDWAEKEFAWAFASTNTPEIAAYYKSIIAWVQNQTQFKPAAKYEFAQEPDGWLITYAGVNGYTVVTHEQLAPDVRKKVPIPNVCEAFSIPYVDTFVMLSRLGFRFR